MRTIDEIKTDIKNLTLEKNDLMGQGVLYHDFRVQELSRRISRAVDELLEMGGTKKHVRRR